MARRLSNLADAAREAGAVALPAAAYLGAAAAVLGPAPLGAGLKSGLAGGVGVLGGLALGLAFPRVGAGLVLGGVVAGTGFAAAGAGRALGLGPGTPGGGAATGGWLSSGPGAPTSGLTAGGVRVQPGPGAYAASHARKADAIWAANGAALAAMVPRVFPGAPPAAIVGFMVNGSQRENTTEAVASQPFHEMGYFGVEGGPRAGPAPNPDPGAPDNSWGRLARDPRVVALLGRPASMVANAWKELPQDQIAVGLVNLADHAAGPLAALGAPVTPGSLWRVATAFTAWSTGAGSLAARYRAHAAALLAVSEEERWATYVAIAAGEPQHGVKYQRSTYTVLRTLQKLASGRRLADRLGQPVAWFGDLDPALADAITQAANGPP